VAKTRAEKLAELNGSPASTDAKPSRADKLAKLNAQEPGLVDRVKGAFGRFTSGLSSYGGGPLAAIPALADAVGGERAGAAMGLGAAEGGSGGLLGEAQGALAAGGKLVDVARGRATLDEVGPAYRKERDEGDKERDAVGTEFPVARNVGQAIGGTALSTAVGPVAAGLASGAGNSNADLTKGEVAEVLTDTGIGGAVGLATHLVGKAGDKLVDKVGQRLLGKGVKEAGDVAAAERQWAGKEAAEAARKQATREAIANPPKPAKGPKTVLGDIKDTAAGIGVDYGLNKLAKEFDVPYLPGATAVVIAQKAAKRRPALAGAFAKVILAAREKGIDQAAAQALFKTLPEGAASAFADELADFRKKSD
jgi:hypothetical protein